MDLAVVRKMKMSRKFNPFINLIAFKSRADIKLAFTNLLRVQGILVKYLEIDLVLARTLFDGEGEGLVPDWVISVLEHFSALLVFLVKPELTKRRVSICKHVSGDKMLTHRHRSKKHIQCYSSMSTWCSLVTYVAKSVFVLQVFGFDYVQENDVNTRQQQSYIQHDDLLTRTVRVPRGAECWDNMISEKEIDGITWLKECLYLYPCNIMARSHRGVYPIFGWSRWTKGQWMFRSRLLCNVKTKKLHH